MGRIDAIAARFHASGRGHNRDPAHANRLTGRWDDPASGARGDPVSRHRPDRWPPVPKSAFLRRAGRRRRRPDLADAIIVDRAVAAASVRATGVRRRGVSLPAFAATIGPAAKRSLERPLPIPVRDRPDRPALVAAPRGTGTHVPAALPPSPRQDLVPTTSRPRRTFAGPHTCPQASRTGGRLVPPTMTSNDAVLLPRSPGSVVNRSQGCAPAARSPAKAAIVRAVKAQRVEAAGSVVLP